MFKRLLVDEAATIFTFVSFLVSASIFVTFLWRALRMKKAQVEHFEKLPFETENPSARHES
jgi:hypothetical protein